MEVVVTVAFNKRTFTRMNLNTTTASNQSPKKAGVSPAVVDLHFAAQLDFHQG